MSAGRLRGLLDRYAESVGDASGRARARTFRHRYLDLLARTQRHVRPRTYLEVGVLDGSSLSLALPGTRSVAVDPEPKVSLPLSRDTTVYAQTSDDFFAGPDAKAALGGRPIDLAFIDGMHHFEFALRDFINIERLSGPNTTVLIHDCYPIDARTAERERTTDIWSGDIWKLIVLLKEWRPDLNIAVYDVAPTGMAVVRGLSPPSPVLAQNYDEIVERYLPLSYDLLAQGDKDAILNAQAYEWARVAERLPARPFRRQPVAPLVAGRALRVRWFVGRRAFSRSRPSAAAGTSVAA